jgi:asparagine synthase (glutamine-hydrolysing)
MAHGLESRVPFLDHPFVELAATIPANIKFKDGTMKQVLKNAMRSVLPPVIADRKDKMGFPTPLNQWVKGDAREFIHDTFSSRAALNRPLVDNRAVLRGIEHEPQYGRKVWGFLCLELWQLAFHDQQAQIRQQVTEAASATTRA